MQNFHNKVAVITGGASGIGRALAEQCVQEGATVVLADIEEAALAETAQALTEQGGTVLPVRTDVSQPAEIERLAQQTLQTFGAVHLLFNNAGVTGFGAGGSVWKSKTADWEWVLGVNLWGVIHSLRTFVPIMLAQESEGYIVNTASMAGLISGEPSASYQVSKHAVVALSENLYHSLARQHAKLKTAVLCPGWVNTRALDSERNRPSPLRVERQMRPEQAALMQTLQQRLANGLPPSQVASQVFAAMRAGQFYILTHPELKELVRQRMEDILLERNPTLLDIL
jgi:NAD(P)-dependent dehydrogenase (short-subunit alcohol dehydrogenase family)